MRFELDGMDQHAKIKVVGVGGGGGNAVVLFQGFDEIVQLENGHPVDLLNEFFRCNGHDYLLGS